MNFICCPPPSKSISPTSIVKSPDDKSISVPSIVMLSIVTPPSTSKLVETIPSVESPGETNEPNEPVEVIELVISLTNVSFPNDDVELLFKYDQLLQYCCKSEPLLNYQFLTHYIRRTFLQYLM